MTTFYHHIIDNIIFDKIDRYQSTNENVAKYIFTKDDAIAEAVLYKYPTYEERTVICCSTQSGCKVGCRFCFLPGTLINTNNGSKKIEDLLPEDLVIGIDGYNQINALLLRMYDGEVVEIELESGEKILVTTDHEMIYDDGTLVDAEKLQVGQKLKGM